MCGRFTLTAPPDAVRRCFGLDSTPELEPRFNVAPGQDVATVSADREGRRVLALRRWGLLPYWAKDPKLGSRLVNARSETAAEKPAYRDAFRRRRCLVPADGFFEWAAAPGGPRQPWYIAREDAACFAIAGLFERWKSPEGEWIETRVLLTSDASPRLAAIHDRMPVILPPADWPLWLDPAVRDPSRLVPLLRPHPDQAFSLRAVSRRVNKPEHDDPACIAPLENADSEAAGPRQGKAAERPRSELAEAEGRAASERSAGPRKGKAAQRPRSELAQAEGRAASERSAGPRKDGLASEPSAPSADASGLPASFRGAGSGAREP